MTLECMFQTFKVLQENHLNTSILRPNQLSRHSMESKDWLHQNTLRQRNKNQRKQAGCLYQDFHLKKVSNCDFCSKKEFHEKRHVVSLYLENTHSKYIENMYTY